VIGSLGFLLMLPFSWRTPDAWTPAILVFGGVLGAARWIENASGDVSREHSGSSKLDASCAPGRCEGGSAGKMALPVAVPSEHRCDR